jgi:hypothetical protein
LPSNLWFGHLYCDAISHEGNLTGSAIVQNLILAVHDFPDQQPHDLACI